MAAQSLILWLAPVCVFVMMTCIGLELDKAQFRRLLSSPRPLLLGMLGQLVLAPAAGFLVAALASRQIAVQLAIVLVVAVPGGPVANGFVLLGRGRPDVSVALTAINGMLALLSTPLLIHGGCALFGHPEVSYSLPVGQTLNRILAIVVLPILLGMIWRERAGPHLTDQVRWTRRLATLMLATILATVMTLALPLLADRALAVAMLVPATVLCLGMFALVAGAARLARLDRSLAMTLALEVGIHNVPLALLIGETLVGQAETRAFIGVYACVIAVAALAWALLNRRLGQRPLTRP